MLGFVVPWNQSEVNVDDCDLMALEMQYSE